VANFGSTTVSVIATASNTVLATVGVGTSPYGVTVTPDGQHAYVANFGSNTVSVIATASNTVVGGPIPVGTGPVGVAVTPDGTHAYVANRDDGTVSVIATSSNTVVATVGVGVGPFGVAVTPDGTSAYVANYLSGTVSVIAPASNTVVATIGVGSLPRDVGIIPTAPALQVTPATNIAATVLGGLLLGPSSFKYQLTATTGSVKVSISGVPSWLNASFTSATVRTSPITVTFSFNVLGILNLGTYHATIVFTNTTNGQGNATRTATLRIL
jgi:YVTN family beta-propeller protein